MPGRSGYLSGGGWLVSGGSSLPGTLTVNSRSGNEPTEYKALELIEFREGFGSGDGDDFTAYIASSEGGDSGGGGGVEGNSDYRYGFNGKERDSENELIQYDYGFRIYDPRLNRFKSVDPLCISYPYYTPYQFAGNSPIELIDLDGGEGGKLLQALNDFCDNIKDWFTFKSEIAEIKEGSDNIAEGVNQQIIGPWNAPKIFNSENPGLVIELNRINGQIQSTTGVVQIASGIQGISNKVQTVIEVPLIIKDLSKSMIKNGTSNAIKDNIKPKASPPPPPSVTSKYDMSESVPEWKSGTNPITGYTKHGLNQAIGREGGRGVKASAILDAVKNPKKILPGSSAGSTVYKGANAKVVLNEQGKVITVSGSKRGPQQRSYHNPDRKSGSGSAQRKANSLGTTYDPKKIY